MCFCTNKLVPFWWRLPSKQKQTEGDSHSMQYSLGSFKSAMGFACKQIFQVLCFLVGCRHNCLTAFEDIQGLLISFFFSSRVKGGFAYQTQSIFIAINAFWRHYRGLHKDQRHCLAPGPCTSEIEPSRSGIRSCFPPRCAHMCSVTAELGEGCLCSARAPPFLRSSSLKSAE